MEMFWGALVYLPVLFKPSSYSADFHDRMISTRSMSIHSFGPRFSRSSSMVTAFGAVFGLKGLLKVVFQESVEAFRVWIFSCFEPELNSTRSKIGCVNCDAADRETDSPVFPLILSLIHI